VQAEIGSTHVVVTWSDGQHIELPHLWLRDNCPCVQCRVEQTEEKIFHIQNVDVNIAASRASVDAHGEHEQLSIVWPDGHRTVFTRAAVEASVAGRYEPELTYWRSEFSPTTVDHDAFFSEPEEAAAALEAFLCTGVLVVTGAPQTEGTLEHYADRLGPIREMFFARIHDVRVDPSGYNVAHTSLPLPPHNDFAGMAWPPSVQALHMLENDCEGGSSVIVDGFGLLEEFRSSSPDLFEALCTVALPFRMFDEEHETYVVAPMVSLDHHRAIRSLRYSNQVMQPMDPTTPGIVDFYRAYHEFSKLVLDRQNQARFRLEGGHVLIVASHRVLHARDEFVPNAARHLQDAYFEHDNLRNSFHVLRRSLTQA